MALKTLGRPKDMEKREAILDAAQALFAERGLDGVPIEQIASASGVSKVTVYGHFGDKVKIFEALAQRETDRLTREIAANAALGSTLEERLSRFGGVLVCTLTQPCHLALERAMSLEVTRRPEMTKVFYNAGPGRVHAVLVDILTDAAERGEIKLDDVGMAAEDLLSLWLGFSMIRRRLVMCSNPTQDEMQRKVDRAVRLFLAGHATV